MNRRLVALAGTIAGALTASVGVALIYLPAALVVGGLASIAICVFLVDVGPDGGS